MVDLTDPSFYAPIEKKYGLPSGILYNLAGAESNFDPSAYNSLSGATGLMQFISQTASQFGIDPTNPQEAVDASGKYLSELIGQKGSLQDALSTYGGGLSGYQHEAARGNKYANALLSGLSVPVATQSNSTFVPFAPVTTVARPDPTSPGNAPSVQAPQDAGRNPLASMLLMQVLQAQMAGTHKFTPVNYDPWKVAGQQSPFEGAM